MDHSQHHSSEATSACCSPKKRRDWLLLISATVIALAYSWHFLMIEQIITDTPFVSEFSTSVFELMNKMWWGILLGIFFVGVLSHVPRELVTGIIGKGGTVNGLFRATAAGVLLDLCSHGILLVGMQLYKRGASLGQVMAFLIASPWNSLSLTLILWALVGLPWMITIVGLSLVIALISGFIFDQLEARGVLPKNPYASDQTDIGFWKPLGNYWRGIHWHPHALVDTLRNGFKESTMIMRWIFFGVVLAAAIQTFVSPEVFKAVFGPTLAGLGFTLIFATILEVCSEGSMPVAADFLLRAKAPGNTFAFLMTGVSTDYTEIMSLKETTRSWKIALFLPLVTVPQVVAIALVLNGFA